MKKKLSKGGKIAIFIIGIIVLLFVVASIVSTPTDGGSDSTSSAAEGGEQQSLKGKVLYEDSNYKVTYVGFEDPGMGVTAFNLSLKIENNSDKKVVATLVDGYANDTAVFFGSGVPVEIMPGKMRSEYLSSDITTRESATLMRSRSCNLRYSCMMRIFRNLCSKLQT